MSVWDGATEVHTSCLIDLSQTPPVVSDVQSAGDSGNWSSLEREYIALADGSEIDTFTIEDDYAVVDGVKVPDDDEIVVNDTPHCDTCADGSCGAAIHGRT